ARRGADADDGKGVIGGHWQAPALAARPRPAQALVVSLEPRTVAAVVQWNCHENRPRKAEPDDARLRHELAGAAKAGERSVLRSGSVHRFPFRAARAAVRPRRPHAAVDAGTAAGEPRLRVARPYGSFLRLRPAAAAVPAPCRAATPDRAGRICRSRGGEAR